MDFDGGTEGESSGQLPPTVGDPGEPRALFVGSAQWIDDVVADVGDDSASVTATTVDVSDARTRLAAERIDCVVVADDVATAEGLSLLGAVRDDNECVTVLVTDDPDDATERAADAAGVTEVISADDGHAWRRTVAALVRQTTSGAFSARERGAALDFYEGVMEGMEDFVVVFDTTGKVTYVSPSIEHITGIEPETLFEAGPFGLVHPDDVPAIADVFWQTLGASSETTAKITTKARHADGTWRLHEAVAANRLDDPRIEGLVVNVRDATDPPDPRSREHEELERLTDGFFALDLDRRFTYVNETTAEELGRSVEDVIGQSLSDVLPETVDIEGYERHQAALDAGESVIFEIEADTGKHYEVRGYPSETGFSIFYRDVTDQRANERQFRAVFEGAADAMVIADDEGRYVDANPAACDLFGLEREALIGRSIDEFAPDGFDFDSAWESFTDASQQRGTFTLVRPDGEQRIVEFSASTDVTSDWHLSILRDVTERRAQQRALEERTERLRSIVENVPIILYAFDESGTFTLSEGMGLTPLGLEPGEVVGESVFDVYGEYPEIIDTCRQALEGHDGHHTVDVGGVVYDSIYQPVFDEDGAVERVIGVSIDITERTQYEQTLAALHDSTRQFLGSETRTEIAERLVEAAVGVLEFPGLIVYLHDDEENVMRPEAIYGGETVFGGRPPVVRPDETSILWTVFTEDEAAVFDDVRTSDLIYSTANRFRSGLFIPLGEHGVLVAGSPDVGAFDERTVDLADLLAATGEAALDRVAREMSLRERDREFEHQNRRLRRLNRIDEIVREIDTALVGAETRVEIERVVCDRLTQADRFAFAWIGGPNDDGDALQTRAWAGSQRGYLDAVEPSLPDATEPAARAVESGAVTVVDNVAAEFRTEPWRTEALARGFQSVLSVPLIHDEVINGVLTIYATQPRTFDESTQSVFGRLGRNVASAIDAVERTHTSVADTVVRLEFAITDDNCLFYRLAREAAGRLTVRGLDLLGTDAVAFVSVEDTTPERFETAAIGQEPIAAVNSIVEYDDGGLFELHLDGPLLATTFPERGIDIHRLVADPSETRFVIDAPESAQLDGITHSISTAYPGATLVSRTEYERPLESHRDVAQRLLGRLTDRQREVSYAAALGGYFESPRTITGADLADVFDVSSPALHGHLRAAQQRVFAGLFDIDDDGTGDEIG